MKAAQLMAYSKEFKISVNEIPVPEPMDNEVLIRVKAAAVNPLEILTATGAVKLIHDYKLPVTLGNECSGIVEKTGACVKGFKKGDYVYSRLPIDKPGALAEYVSVDYNAIARMPAGYEFATAAAIPLAGLTAYQGIVEELEAKPGDTVLITGGSGSFGQMAVPVAKALGLRVIVTGNERSREQLIKMGADIYLDYKKEFYWEKLSGIDNVIDTLGPAEFEHELSVLKSGGRLLSLRTSPNKAFAIRNNFPWYKRILFALAGSRYDSKAKKQGKEYRFMFVKADGNQLCEVTKIVEEHNVVPAIAPHIFSLEQINDAMRLVSHGKTNGKVIIRF